MFNNKLKLGYCNKPGYPCVKGSIIVSGDGGKKILITAKEKIRDGNLDEATTKVVNQISSAVEYFPLKDLIGEASFVKAIRLYATLKKGSPEQKRNAKKEIELVCRNSREAKDPTSQDIDYALARFFRKEQDEKVNISGDFMFDAFGFSPRNLKNNLDKLAAKNPLMKNARDLYMMLTSGDQTQVKKAVALIRQLYARLNSEVVSGTRAHERTILVGLSQYMKAHNMSKHKKRLFGEDTVTLGFSFKKTLKKAGKKIKSGVKKTGRAIKKSAPAALAVATLGPAAIPMLATKRGRAFVKKATNVAVKTAIITSMGPAAIPVLASKKGRKALGLVKAAKAGNPRAKAAIQETVTKSKLGHPSATANLKIFKTAQKADESLPKAMTDTMVEEGEGTPYETEQPQYEEPYEGESESFAKEDEQPEEQYEEQQQEEFVDEQDDSQDYDLTESPDELLGLSLSSLKKSIKKAVTPGKTFKAVASVAKPFAKMITPLAAKAADSFAPGSGVAITAAMPALIDAIPSNKQPDMSQIAKGMDLVKAATEMDPEALQKIGSIKELAKQGITGAEQALNALKIAKATQKVAETVADQRCVAPQQQLQLTVKREGGNGSGGSGGGSFEQTKPIDVRIVEWAK